MTKLAALALPIALLLVQPQRSDAKSCVNPDNSSRWRNFLMPCDVVPDNCTNTGLWSFGQWSTYWNAQFKATKQEACDSLVDKLKSANLTPTQKAKRAIIGGTGDPDSVYCIVDFNEDGVANEADWSNFHPPIHRVTDSAEPMCDLTPNGPYADSVNIRGTWPSSYGPGRDFSTTIKDRVKAVNQGSTNHLWSDAYDLSANGQAHLDYFNALHTISSVGWKATPQIDHIIPRVDKRGCACGRNTPANALVISGQLNNEMSNNSQHPTRIALLQFFTTSGTPHLEDSDDTNIDEAAETEISETDELGGCSTSGASGGTLALALGALALRRRRR